MTERPPVRPPGPRSGELIARWERVEGTVTGRLAPVAWERASGVTVWDADGNEYLDWTSGVLVTNVGHAHPRLVAAVAGAAGDLLNCFEFPTERRVQAGEALLAHLPDHLDRCFFQTTGSEAVEAALRLMKRHTANYEVIGFTGAFHGRTAAAAALGGMATVKEGFGPPVPGVIRAPYPYPYRSPVGGGGSGLIDYCMDRLDEAVRANSTGSLAGLVVEPYLGTAGFVFPPDGYLTELQRWTRSRGIPLAVDEVQSGYGRTGRLWGFEWDGVEPDVVAIGKGLGSGYPVSAVAGRAELWGALQRGDLTSTMGGNPVAAAAVIEVLAIMDDEQLVDNASRMGAVMMDRLRDVQDRSPFVGDVRGRGLVMGIEVVADKRTKEPSREITLQLLDRAAGRGLLIGAVGIFGNVIRVAPPLCITEAEVHDSVDRLAAALGDIVA